MNPKAALESLGLTDGESAVYLALLKNGESTASAISRQTKQHRTTVYDFLDHLVEKGLASYTVTGKVRTYTAAPPERLVELAAERLENIRDIVPKLAAISNVVTPRIKVEIFDGAEGFKMMLNDRLSTRQPLYGFGIDETYFEERFSIPLRRYIRQQQRLGLKEYLLTKESAKFIYRYKDIIYRYIPDEFFDPTSTIVYADRVFIIIWEPMTSIMFRSQGLADSYKHHHRLLWKLASEKPVKSSGAWRGRAGRRSR